MTTLRLLLAATICSTSSLLNAQIKFETGSWQESLSKAQQENKFIFVDAYTTWCGPCKWMDANVFQTAEAGTFFNKSFVCVKLDMEKEGDGLSFAKTYAIRSYPSFVFFNSKGEIVHRAVGSRSAEDFIKLGTDAMDENSQFYTFKNRYEVEKNNPDFLLDYCDRAAGAGVDYSPAMESYLKLTNEKNWEDAQTWKTLVNLSIPFGSNLYLYAMKNQDKIISYTSAQETNYMLDRPKFNYYKTVLKDSGNTALPEARIFLNKLPNKEKATEMNAELEWMWYEKYQPENVWEKQVIYLDQYCKNAAVLNSYAWTLVENNEKDINKLKKGLEWIDKSIGLQKSYYNLDTRAWLLYGLDRNKEALAAAKEAVKQGKEEGEDVSATLELIELIPE